MEAEFAESVNMRNEVMFEGEIAGAFEERISGGAETVVALEDFLDGVVVETRQNP